MEESARGRQRLLRRLRARERRYRQLLEQLPDPVVVTRRGRIRFANRAAATLLGAESCRELHDARYSDFILSATRLPAGRGERQELRRLDGQVVDVEAIVAGRPDNQRILLRDLSRRDLMSYALDTLHSEEEIRQSQRMEAVGRLASGIAHDFNNLITAIHGHAQFLYEDLPADDPAREDVAEILHSAERAAGLTRQLVAFSRGRTVQRDEVDLNEIATSIERLLRRVISEDISLVATLDPALSVVRADPGQIEQILVNLIVNARDAMPAGGTVTIKTANVELDPSYAEKDEAIEPGTYVMLAVSDTGVGMEKAVQEHIFEPFFTTKRAGKGSGLGLASVYGIVRQSGGHIFVYSEPGKGTTFKVYLPAATTNGEQSVTEPRPAQRAQPGETVLLIEDDQSVRALARRVLTMRGYEVVEADSGAAALARIAEIGADLSLVICDVMLPDATGMSLVATIQQRVPGLRALLMSGYTSEDVRRQGLLPPGVGFMEKPFTPDTLVQVVRETLDRPPG